MKKLIFFVFGVALIGVGVFYAMEYFLGTKLDYNIAFGHSVGMLKDKEEISDFLSKEKLLDFDDTKKIDRDNFEKRVMRLKEYYESLRISKAMQDLKVKEKYDELGVMPEKLLEVAKIAQLTNSLSEKIESKNIAQAEKEAEALTEMNNNFLQRLGRDIQKYLRKSEELNMKQKEKDNKNKNKQNDVVDLDSEQYLLEEDLNRKYEEKKLLDVINVTEAELAQWFEKVESLKDLLETKK